MRTISRHAFIVSLVISIFFGSCMSSSQTDTEIIPSPGGRARDISDDQVCKNTEIDWWSVSCSSSACYWSFMYTETRVTCWYTGGPGDYGVGGGGGTFFDFVPSVRPLDDLLNKITASNQLNPAQTQQLKEALSDFINRCLQKAIYDMTVAKGLKYNFKIDPNSQLATYNPNNKQLTFQSSTYIDEQYFREELFHGYQDSYYDNGIGQYGSSGGLANIEFEAKLFKDILGAVEGIPGQTFGVPYGNPKHDEYQSWISEITSSYTKYPTQINLAKYFEFLEAFKDSYPNYNSPTISTLKPDALMNAINGSNCSK